jgi:hypothetical protein
MRAGSRVAGLIVLAVVAVVAAASAPRIAHAEGAAQPAQPPDDRARFAGTFRFGGASAEETARRAAIDKTIGTLFFAIRGIARSRLSNGTKIDPWVSFAFGQGQIRMRVPSATDAASPEQGSTVDYVNDGDRVRLSQRLAGGTLTQIFTADEGRRMNEWTLAPDARTLVLKVTVTSSKLRIPLVYTLTYQRT